MSEIDIDLRLKSWIHSDQDKIKKLGLSAINKSAKALSAFAVSIFMIY